MTTKEQGFYDQIKPRDLEELKKHRSDEFKEKNDEQQNRKDKASWAMHLAMVKMAIVQPKKTHEVEVSGLTKYKKPYHYTYKYADLADVDRAIMDSGKTKKEIGKAL